SGSTASAPVPQPPVPLTAAPEPPDSYTQDPYTQDSFTPDSYAADEPETPVPTPLRLVTPQRDESPDEPDDEGDDELDPEPADFAEPESDEDEPEDIWSRLRDRSLPPWIPFLIGAATATLAAVAVLFAALRRLRRRDFPGE